MDLFSTPGEESPFLYILGLFFLLLIVAKRTRPRLRNLVVLALILRVAGSFLYYAVMTSAYGGGDYVLYYQEAVSLANRFRQLDFSPIFDSRHWIGGVWWGTQFICFPSGILIAVLGANLIGTFIVFSLLAFAGIAGFAIAFRETFPRAADEPYLRWIWLFPSLWFWSSALGKDALLLFGIGTAVRGFVGRNDRINWWWLVLGFSITFAVRPQVAVVFAFSLIAGQWLAANRNWGARRVAEGLVILCAGIVVGRVALARLGAGGLEAEGVQSYVASRGQVSVRSAQGVNSTGVTAQGISGIPIGFVNILFRPFPWEATNVTLFLTSAEIWGMWIVMIVKWREVLTELSHWRKTRLTAFAAVFVIVYATLLGMTVVNFGIIARQRVHVFPLLFLMFAGGAASRRGRAGLAPGAHIDRQSKGMSERHPAPGEPRKQPAFPV